MDSILSIQRNSSMMQPTMAIHQIKELFGTEVKWKRVLQELSDMNLLEENPSFQITPIGLRIPFQHGTQTYRFQLRIDNNYPFTKPQIHSMDKAWRYGEARDLLEYGFEEGEEWDCRMTFSDVQLCIPNIVSRIRETEQQIGSYHLFDKYFREQLSAKGLQLYDVAETKKKLLITQNVNKIIAFGREVFLKFDIVDSHLMLQLLLRRSQIKQVQKNQDLKQLKIVYQKNPRAKQQHFRIECKEWYEEIIYNLNPISFIQNKVAEISDEECRSQEMLTNLTTLVSFYADKNKSKSAKYLKKLQNIVCTEDIHIQEKEESEK